MKKTGLLLAATSIYLPFSPALADGPHRKVTGPEPGKCIFSKQLMPPDKYSNPAYSRVTNEFGTGEPVHARCFYAKPLGQYESVGRSGNSLRDLRRYYAVLEWERPANLRGSYRTARVRTINRDYENDERLKKERFELLDSPRCTFAYKGSNNQRKHKTYASGCINLADYVKAAASRAGKSAPPYGEFCLRIYIDTANNMVTRRYDDGWRTHPEYKMMDIAKGCFKVALNGSVSSAPNPSNPVNSAGSIQRTAAEGRAVRPAPDAARLPKPKKPKKPKIKKPRIKIPGGIF